MRLLAAFLAPLLLWPQDKPAPDFANVSYGPHERNVIDFWKGAGDRPAPLVIFIHGGGFVGGDKTGIDPVLLRLIREQGWNAASINYRYSTIAPYPGPMRDSARALQFLRSKARDWNIDTANIFLTGGSAGAATSLWIGFRDEMAEPQSPDPVARQSTRITAAALRGAQTFLDPREVRELISPVAANHPALPTLFGKKTHDEVWNSPELDWSFRDASPLNWLTRDDPPVLLLYNEGPEPVPANARPGAGIHHIRFGYRLKTHMDKLGIECVVRHAKELGADPVPKFHEETIAFFKKHIRSSPGGNLVSPEVHPDRRVTFRMHAPNAKSVGFAADWMPAGTQQAMTRGGNGVWELTLGPLDPNVYIYTFNVDGATVADPVNPRIKLRSRTSASMVEVHAASPQPWDIRDVPHGKVDIQWQKSKALGDTRWIWIYTPPGYDRQRDKSYPVLYLFHGSNDIAGGWVLAGHANFIADNLIADGKARPMIIVMPYGHAVPFGSPREVQAKNVEKYESYMMQDVIPFIESSYRVVKNRDHRAIAGLSMGGGQSLHIGFGHIPVFSSIAAFSSAAPQDFETRFASVLSNAADTNRSLRNVWIGCGKQDFALKRNQELAALLTSRGIRHQYVETEGAHTYSVWRSYLSQFIPLLFK